MPSPATSTTAAANALASFFTAKAPNISSLPLISATPIPTAAAKPPKSRTRRTATFSCRVAITSDVSSSSSSPSSLTLSDEEAEAISKEGKRIRVKVPLKVYHVPKAPELDLNGMEGVIKQYVGIWKGKRISSNLPFKVEFFVTVESQPKPVRFFVHLKEDEFEFEFLDEEEEKKEDV